MPGRSGIPPSFDQAISRLRELVMRLADGAREDALDLLRVVEEDYRSEGAHALQCSRALLTAYRRIELLSNGNLAQQLAELPTEQPN